MKSKLVLILALFSFSTYAVEFGEENLAGTLFQTVTLHSNELQEKVTNDLSRLIGMGGTTINGERKGLFPLKLIQGFRKPAPDSFPLEAKIYFQNEEVSVTKRGLLLTGKIAHFLFDLMENNFFNLDVKKRFLGTYKVAYNHISCVKAVGETAGLTCILDTLEEDL